MVPASASPAHKAYSNVEFTYSARGGVAAGYDVGQVQHIRIRSPRTTTAPVASMTTAVAVTTTSGDLD